MELSTIVAMVGENFGYSLLKPKDLKLILKTEARNVVGTQERNPTLTKEQIATLFTNLKQQHPSPILGRKLSYLSFCILFAFALASFSWGSVTLCRRGLTTAGISRYSLPQAFWLKLGGSLISSFSCWCGMVLLHARAARAEYILATEASVARRLSR